MTNFFSHPARLTWSDSEQFRLARQHQRGKLVDVPAEGCQAMLTRYLKRFRMEIDLRRAEIPRAVLPTGYRWQAWHRAQLEHHAVAKHASFSQELDSILFSSLGTLSGCRELMTSISRHEGFLPQATWLIEFVGNDIAGPVPCGTIQGLVHSSTLGSVQNVGVIPEHRGFGLGRALILKALRGFKQYGLLRVYLEVTAENRPAVELYESVGFRRVSTSYRELGQEVEVAS